MQDKNSLSIPDKLLLAAYELEVIGKRPFSAEDLVVAAWQKFPNAFGLPGYRDKEGQLSHPDSNRVFAEIMGSKPIRKRGLLIKVGKKMYQLTEAGREQARILLNRSGESSVEKAGLARETEQELKRLFASKAVEKFKNNRLSDLTSHDACAFWRISPRSSAIEFDGRINNFVRVVEAARNTIQREKVTFEHGGDTYSAQDLNMLLTVHHELLARFHDEIEIIRKRKDERK